MELRRLGYEFQLHHTGIKTNAAIARKSASCHFNCTIQELKLVTMANTLSFM